MAKGKDFYGKDISEVIEQACKELTASSPGELDIEVLETGSAGIFGLCKKKAHIRARRKTATPAAESRPKASRGRREAPAAQNEPDQEEAIPQTEPQQELAPAQTTQPAAAPAVVMLESAAEASESAEQTLVPKSTSAGATPSQTADDVQQGWQSAQTVQVVQTAKGEESEKALSGEEEERGEEELSCEPPAEEDLSAIREIILQLLTLMKTPSEVQVVFEQNTVLCTINGSHEETIIGPEGRTLDSLQYLLRKMISRHLPDRVLFTLNAGNFREKRVEDLKVKALDFAELVKADSKTRSIPALNPAERRLVHMVLQEDKAIRSRSVGDGLFKKVLIYKPGVSKGRRSSPRKRQGGQGGRSSGD